MSEKPVAFRLPENDKAMIREMAEISDRTQTAVVRTAIKALYDQVYLPIKAREEKRGKRGLAVFERLKQVFGPDFYKGHGGVGFIQVGEDDVMVRVGDQDYLEFEGRLYATRVRGGRAEYAEVEDGGTVGDWIAAANPQLN